MTDNPAVMDELDIFLSYHRTPGDQARVERVRARLATVGVRAFMDRTHLVAGLPYYEALEQALRRCSAVAVFVGAELGGWQVKERSFALERQLQEHKLGRAFPVVPVLLPGAKVETAFLFQNTWVDLRTADDDDAEIDKLLAALRYAQAHGGERRPLLEVCPYRGLNDFGEEDAALFHGREALVDQLLERVLNRDLVVVVGSSGTGKSSLVKAGLLPRLRRIFPPAVSWDVVVFKPGSNPYSSLARAVRRWLDPHASVWRCWCQPTPASAPRDNRRYGRRLCRWLRSQPECPRASARSTATHPGHRGHRPGRPRPAAHR